MLCSTPSNRPHRCLHHSAAAVSWSGWVASSSSTGQSGTSRRPYCSVSRSPRPKPVRTISAPCSAASRATAYAIERSLINPVMSTRLSDNSMVPPGSREWAPPSRPIEHGLQIGQSLVRLGCDHRVVRGVAYGDEHFQYPVAGRAELLLDAGLGGSGHHLLLGGSVHSAPQARNTWTKPGRSAGPSKATYSGSTRCWAHFSL